jgi:hypothetical protein
MIGLVNFAKEPCSVEVRKIPIAQIGEDDVLLRKRLNQNTYFR